MPRKVIGTDELKNLPKVDDYLAEIVAVSKRYGLQLLGTTEDGEIVVDVRDESHKTAHCERCHHTFMPAHICPKCGVPTTAECNTAEGDHWLTNAHATAEVAEHFEVKPPQAASA